MSRAITVWLDDEADLALSQIEASGPGESAAVCKAIIEAAAHTKLHKKVTDADTLERALDKSHELVARILTTERPPR
ncbi:MAG: hypothetical protein GY788_18295 [bacterium]|nr:hypothetical protein [bacterium]